MAVSSFLARAGKATGRSRRNVEEDLVANFKDVYVSVLITFFFFQFSFCTEHLSVAAQTLPL